MLKHFTIGLLLELWQQLYEQVVTIDEVDEVAKNNEKNVCNHMCNPWPKQFNFWLNLNRGGIKNELSHGVDHGTDVKLNEPT